MRLFLVVLAFLYLLASNIYASGLNDYLDTLSLNKWVAVSTNNIDNVKPSPLPSGSHDNVIDAWSGGTYRADGNEFLVWGGGHADYAGNELYSFNMDSLKWFRIWGPTPNDDIPESGTNETYDDGNPGSRHTYDGLTYIPAPYNGDGAFFSYGGSLWYTGNASVTCWTFSFSDSTWDAVETISTGTVHARTCYDYINGDVYVSHTSTITKFDTSNNTAIEVYTPSYSGDGAMAFSGIDTSVYYFAGGTLYKYSINGDSHSSVSTSGETGVQSSGAHCLEYERNMEQLIGWSGGQDIYVLNMSTHEWSITTMSGADPGSYPDAGTFGRFFYMEDYNAIGVVNSTTGSLYVAKLSTSTGGSNSGSVIQTFSLTADTTDTCAFTVGLAFKKGDVTSVENMTMDIDDYQVEEMKTWNDGSLKHAIVSGTASMTANTAKSINVYDNGTRPSGTTLAESDIVTASPSASVGLSGIDTISLGDLLGSPVRTWIDGISMVEAHYQTDVSNDLSVSFHVRLYSSDDIWIRATVENGLLTTDGTSNESYTPFIEIDGDTVFSNGGASLTHYANTRYAYEGWIGNDPDIYISQDCDYLESTGLVPNYWKDASETALNGLDTIYTINSNEGWTASMGEAGFQDQIGLLPLWDALYITSDGDRRAYKSVIVNAKALNHYGIIWGDSVLNKPIILTKYDDWTVDGSGGGGASNIVRGSLTWNGSHHGSGGYFAYLITGDYYHLETMKYQTSLCYLVISSSRGDDTTRVMISTSTRAVAWTHRTVGQCVAIAPSDTSIEQYHDWLHYSSTYWESERTTEGMNQIGYIYDYSASAPNFAYGPGETAPWMQHFFQQTFGYITDCEPLSNMTYWKNVRDYLYQGSVGILGPNGTDYYCFTNAGAYSIVISAVDDVTDPTVWYDSWGDVFEATTGSPNTSCANTLTGSSGSAPSSAETGYWGNLLPAIAYAVEDTATGAYDAWTRLTGATNWSDVENAGFEDIPVWGIYPRATPQADGNGSSSTVRTMKPGGPGVVKEGGTGVLKP